MPDNQEPTPASRMPARPSGLVTIGGSLCWILTPGENTVEAIKNILSQANKYIEELEQALREPRPAPLTDAFKTALNDLVIEGHCRYCGMEDWKPKCKLDVECTTQEILDLIKSTWPSVTDERSINSHADAGNLERADAVADRQSEDPRGESGFGEAKTALPITRPACPVSPQELRLIAAITEITRDRDDLFRLADWLEKNQ